MKQIHDTNIIPVGTIHAIYKTIPQLITGNISLQKDYILEDSSTDFISANVKIGNKFLSYIEDNATHYMTRAQSSTYYNNNWTYYFNSDDSKGYYLGDIFMNGYTGNNMAPFVTINFYYIDGTNYTIKVYPSSDMKINSPLNKKVWKINFYMYATGNTTQTKSIYITYVKINICSGIIKAINDSNSLAINQNCFNNISSESAPGAVLKYIIYDEYNLNKNYEYCDGQILYNNKSPLHNKEIPCLNIGDSFIIGSNISGEYIGANYHIHHLAYSGEGGGNEGWGSWGNTAGHEHYTNSVDNRPPTKKTIYVIKVL